MDRTANLDMPYIMPSQAQKHVTHNEALASLDALVQLSVADRDLAAAPGSPAEGDRYIVSAAATGAWAGHDDDIAVWRDGAWVFHAPAEGWLAWVADEATPLVFTGSAWAEFGSALGALQNLSLLGIGTTADAANPLSARLNSILLTAKYAADGGDGDLRATANKETAGDTVSYLFQTGYSGRAEFGLIGDDDFTIKVSADGSTWREALKVDRSDGLVRLPQGQLAFPASQNASADPNVLDDYEEGSFAPVIAGSTTPGSHSYSQQFGHYTRVGNVVHCWGFVTIDTLDGAMAGSFAFIAGLPFAHENVSGDKTGGNVSYHASIGNSRRVKGLLMTPNSDFAYVTYSANGTTGYLSPGDIQVGSSLVFHISYRVA